MIADIENELYTTIATELREQFPSIYITGEPLLKPPSFPCVSMVEDDTSTYRRTVDSSGEHHSAVHWTVEVYSNLTTGKKTQCKEIIKVIDEILTHYNFERISTQPIPNYLDASKYRIIGRYRALVDEDGTIYRR